MHQNLHTSATHQMYLKVILGASDSDGVTRVRDVAQGLGVNPGTVSTVLKKLERLHFVHHDRYGAVRLTPAGRDAALEVQYRYDVLRAVLHEVLGMDEQTAEREACLMEHVVGPATAHRLECLLHLTRSERIDTTALHAPHSEDGQPCPACAELGLMRTADTA